MANTNPDDLEKLCNNECPNQNGEKVDEDISKKFVALTPERVEFLVDLMRAILNPNGEDYKREAAELKEVRGELKNVF